MNIDNSVCRGPKELSTDTTLKVNRLTWSMSGKATQPSQPLVNSVQACVSQNQHRTRILCGSWEARVFLGRAALRGLWTAQLASRTAVCRKFVKEDCDQDASQFTNVARTWALKACGMKSISILFMPQGSVESTGPQRGRTLATSSQLTH